MPTVRTNDVETYYARRGDGPPLILVHGAILDHTAWEPLVDALAGEYTTIVYDVRGHGRTGGSSRASYSIDLFADDLHALVTALDLDRPVLCGHSMGGCIAQAYASTRSDALAGLVLADTFGPTIFDRREWIQRSVLLRAAVPPVRLLGYERVERALVWLQERIHGEGVSGDYHRIERLRESGPEMDTDEFGKVIRALAAFRESEIDYSSIAVPALILYGERELPFIRRHAAKMEAAIPNASLREVPGAGHASNLDNPDFFSDVVRRFLARIESAEPSERRDGESLR